MTAEHQLFVNFLATLGYFLVTFGAFSTPKTTLPKATFAVLHTVSAIYTKTKNAP